VISIRGRKHWLWRAIDTNGDVLEILMQSRRNAHAAKRFLMKLMKRWGVPRVIVPPLMVCKQTTAGQCMGRFKSPGQAQRFLSVHDQTATIFRPKRHRLSAAPYRQSRADAFSLWNNYAAEMAA
jgi:putative transposase